MRSYKMLFEYGDFDFLFLKDEDHAIILSFQFLCAMGMWRLQSHCGSLGFPFHLSSFCQCFLRKQAMPKQENAFTCEQAAVAGLQGGRKPGAKGEHVNGDSSEAIKESPIGQGKADWPGLIQEKMETLCWCKLEQLVCFSPWLKLSSLFLSFMFVVYSLVVAWSLKV